MSDENTTVVPERHWGFIAHNGKFVMVPKTPILLADKNFKPPGDIETLFGTRHIIEEPE